MTAPSLVFLASVLSLDVTRVLVANGYGLGYDSDAAQAAASGAGRFTGAIQPSASVAYAPLAIVGCTGNGAPIVVTTQYPHGVSTRGIGGMACIVSGVAGNTAANNVSTNPLDRTVGLSQGVLAVPVPNQPNQLALYGQDQIDGSPTVGRLIPLVGNGAWAGGGTIAPAFTDCQILLGRENIREHSAAPRIVMVPRSIQPGPRTASSANPRTRANEIKNQKSQRLIATDQLTFDVHCWGQRLPTPDPAYDFDVCLALQQAFKDSAHLIFGHTTGGETEGPSTWDDEKERATQLIKEGHLLTFSTTISVPVLDNALGFVTSGAGIGVTVQTNTPEVAAVINKTLS